MIHKISKHLSRFWEPESGPYALLVLLFVTVFVLSPLYSARMYLPLILEIAFALIIVVGAFNVSSRTSVRLSAVILALLSLVLEKLGLPFSQRAIAVSEILLSVAMLSVFTLLLIKRFLPRGLATAHRIAGAVTVYLLIGLIWARLYQVVELVSPGSFRIPEGEILNSATLAYFSFVTLATVGYGDIAPVNIVARNLSVIEAIMGQLYLVVLISRLVSEGSTQSRKEQDTPVS